MTEPYYPQYAINLASVTGKQQMRLGLQGYPKVGKPLVDADEGALLSLLMEIKQHQLSMMVIVDAINTLQTKGEQ